MKKDCQYYRELFPAYLEGHLGAETRREIASHLNDCPGCAARFSQEWRNSLDGGEPAVEAVERPRRRGLLARVGRGSRLHLGLVLIAAAVLLFMHFRRRAGEGFTGDGLAGPAVLEARAGDRAEGAMLLAEALVSLRRNYPTTDMIPRRQEVKTSVYALLEKLRKTLAEAVQEGRVGKGDARRHLAGLIHPDFLLSYEALGRDPIRSGREDVVARPSPLAELVREWRDFRWWDWEEESLTLWAFGEGKRRGTLVVLARDQAVGKDREDLPTWRLLYVNYREKEQAPAHRRHR